MALIKFIAVHSSLITGIWLIFFSLILNAGNFKSSLVFKIFPFFLGLCCLVTWGYTIGLLKL